ncbi:MAG TPA: type III-B CRISPR module-associated protein Cmr5 [Myxococcota bacterium]|nr:type III-B CRISPR module-associated protein Cmr5 [Myxococcota bacterium]
MSDADPLAARRVRHAFSSPVQGRARADLPGLPVLFRTQGLVMTFAWIRERSPQVADAITAYLANQGGDGWAATPLKPRDGASARALVEAWIKLDAAQAAAVEHEALRYAEQLKLVDKLRGGA